LQVGSQRWLLLPDRQALRSVELQAADGGDGGLSGRAGHLRRSSAGLSAQPITSGANWNPATGIWLGFEPRRSERSLLHSHAAGPVWISGDPPGGPPLAPGWNATGANGSLSWAGG